MSEINLSVKSSVNFMTEYCADDEVVFSFEGLLVGRVERVTFNGRKVRYEVSAVLTLDVPESAIIGREADVLGETEEKGGIERARDTR